MACIERIRFFHHVYLDALQKNGGRLYLNLRRQCLLEVGITVDDKHEVRRTNEIRLLVSIGLSIKEVWELQDRIFSMWEWKEVK